jgi:hypothetical protein
MDVSNLFATEAFTVTFESMKSVILIHFADFADFAVV